jgi:hypothetical protein
MSRGKIALVVTLVMVALTATALVLTTSNLEQKIKDDVRRQVTRSRDLLLQNASFESLDLMKRAENFARVPAFPGALSATDKRKQALDGAQAIREALSNLKPDEPRPDFLALVDKDGQLIAIDPSGEYATDWKKRPAVQAALERRTTKDVWEWENSTMKVAVAPVSDRQTNDILGAVVAAYAFKASEADNQAKLLGMEVAYYFDGKVRVTSFGKAGASKDEGVSKLLYQDKVGGKTVADEVKEKRTSAVTEVSIAGEPYVATAGQLPLNYADKTSGAVVLMSLAGALEPVSSVRTTIILVGLAGLIIAILGIFLTARLILSPAEDIELGVTEIINGNIDYTFKPAGADLDGLANALNVMLARLIGRPEPGEEEFDENGNVIGANSRMTLEDAETPPAGGVNADVVALAEEPEADYYRRLFNEYVSAKRSSGENVDGVHYDAFTAKLRLNEANLKKKYNARAVRFRVVIKDGSVTLKPVPIL